MLPPSKISKDIRFNTIIWLSSAIDRFISASEEELHRANIPYKQ